MHGDPVSIIVKGEKQAINRDQGIGRFAATLTDASFVDREKRDIGNATVTERSPSCLRRRKNPG